MKKEHSGKRSSNLTNKAKNSHLNYKPNTLKNTPKSNKQTAQNNNANRKDFNQSRNGNSSVTVVLKKDLTKEA